MIVVFDLWGRQSVNCKDSSAQIDAKHLNIEQFSSEQREPDDERNILLG